MRTTIRATTALALLAACLPAMAATATLTRAWQYKTDVAAGLEVRNLIGDIRVERGTDAGIPHHGDRDDRGRDAGPGRCARARHRLPDARRRPGFALRRGIPEGAVPEDLLREGPRFLVERRCTSTTSASGSA